MLLAVWKSDLEKHEYYHYRSPSTIQLGKVMVLQIQKNGQENNHLTHIAHELVPLAYRTSQLSNSMNLVQHIT